VNDKYMGRSAEFLGDMTVKEMPSDFPVYEKTMSREDYDKVVHAYYVRHTEILTEKVLNTLSAH
jgi:hypothetical protein